MRWSTWRVARASASAGLLAGGLLAASGPACGELIEFFGEDPNGSATVPLSAAELVNSSAAEAAFRVGLDDAVTEDFEGIATATGTPLAIFSGTTTLGGSGSVAFVETGTSNGAGRYSVPIPDGSTQYWDVGAGAIPTFTIDYRRWRRSGSTTSTSATEAARCA